MESAALPTLQMLARFATGASFSADSRGGGRESNSRFLPFMIQMARHLLDEGSSSQCHTMAKAVSTYLSSSAAEPRPSTPPGVHTSGGTEDTVQFMMVTSLLSESYESWSQHRRAFLQRGIYHAYMQRTHGRPSRASPDAITAVAGADSGCSSGTASAGTGGANELFSTIQPMLVYTGLIEQLQHFCKVKRRPTQAGPARAEGTSSSGEESVESWESVMKERLLNAKEMMGFSKELLLWLDDMNSACDLQEAFDVMGVLADVLSSGFAQCEEFVQAAIDAGKS